MPRSSKTNNDSRSKGVSNENGDMRKAGLSHGADKWYNEHGKPDYLYLKALVDKNSSEALEVLKTIANDHNVNHDAGISAEELLDKIVFATQQEDGNQSI